MRRLDGDWCFDAGVRVVVEQLEIINAEAVDCFYFRVELHLWQWAWFAGELELGLLYVITSPLTPYSPKWWLKSAASRPRNSFTHSATSTSTPIT